MSLSRRELVTGMGSLAAVSALGDLRLTSNESPGPAGAASVAFPRKEDFAIPLGLTYINAAYTHPLPKVAAESMRAHVLRRSTPGMVNPQPVDPKAEFASLINASASEISYIPNTSTGENLVVNGLEITKFDGNVVTDELHFEGALVHLLELKKQGLDLRIVRARDGRIDMVDMERVIDRKTKLVEVSLVAMYNGFQHDLKAVCDLAHAHGAYVYADIIQGVGAVPFDVKKTGVDFCATSCFKWLMGDFGAGFLYARKELLERVIKRTHWGYHSTSDMGQHYPPFDPNADRMVTYTLRRDASGYFESGNDPAPALAAVGASIQYIKQLGVDAIHAWRQPLLEKLQREMPRLGFTPATPRGTTSPIVTFAMKDAVPVRAKLAKANVNVRVADYFIRIAPSVYNDMSDVDRLLEALA